MELQRSGSGPAVDDSTRYSPARSSGSPSRPVAPAVGSSGNSSLLEVDEGEEQRSGLTPRQRRVSSLLTQLATTARSFALYDIRNEAIQNFLTTLLESFLTILAEEQELLLTVQPFELHFEGVPVYVNRDGERSLAFRLHRDGVRTLRFRNGFHWKELARLLEILSIRYSGVHQNEDDVVTLLWKANFQNLDVFAVQGFVSQEEAPDGDSTSVLALTMDVLAPEDWRDMSVSDQVDLSRAFLPSPPFTWTVVPDEVLAELCQEVADVALPEECLLLLRRLRQRMGSEAPSIRFQEAVHLFCETRDFLLSEDNLEPMLRFVAFLQDFADEAPPSWDVERPAQIRDLARSCGEPAAVVRLLRSVPPESRELKVNLLEFLDAVCADPLDPLIDALAFEYELSTRAVARQLLEHYAANRIEFLVERFEKAGGTVSCDLLRVMGRIGGDAVAGFAALQVSHPNSEVRNEALTQLERMPYSPAVGRALSDAFAKIDAARRPRVLELIARSGDARFEELLTKHLEARGGQMPAQEAMEIGKTLGQLGGTASVRRWEEWLTPKGLFRKLLPGAVSRQVAAAAALSQIPGEKPAQVLRTALVSASVEAHDWIGQALAQQRALSRRPAP